MEDKTIGTQLIIYVRKPEYACFQLLKKKASLEKFGEKIVLGRGLSEILSKSVKKFSSKFEPFLARLKGPLYLGKDRENPDNSES